MKKLIALLVLFSLNTIAQNFNLANISSGDYIYFTSIHDNNEKLYGYFSLYDLGKENKKDKIFEFFVLDKNLNKVLSNKIYMPKEIQYIIPYINVDGDLILTPYSPYLVDKDFIMPKSKKLSLKTNEIEDYNFYCYEDNTFVDCPENKSFREKRKELRKNKKDKDFIDESDV